MTIENCAQQYVNCEEVECYSLHLKVIVNKSNFLSVDHIVMLLYICAAFNVY